MMHCKVDEIPISQYFRSNNYYLTNKAFKYSKCTYLSITRLFFRGKMLFFLNFGSTAMVSFFLDSRCMYTYMLD